jgi:predicted amidohydrolase
MGQLLVEGGEPYRNLERAAEMIQQASEKKCHIVLLPECLDLGWLHPSARTESKTIPGPYSDILCNAAKKHKIYVCAGLTESANNRIYNSAVFIDPEGNILLKYRKINELVIAQEFYSIGDSLAVLETPFGIVGLNICADNYIDSLTIGHTLARMGAQIIFSPSAWTVDFSVTNEGDPYGEKWVKPFSILAKLYNLVIVSTTSVGVIVGGAYEGKKSIGCSLAVNKDGVIAQGTYNEFASELIIANINIPERPEKGTAIGDMLLKKGFKPSEPL